MNKLGIIAGNGVFPLEVATAARRRGRAVIAVAHRGETDERLAGLCQEITWVRVGELQTMIDGCSHGRVVQCRVIEVLADHGQCVHPRH